MKTLGTATSSLKVRKVKEVKCPNCGNENQLNIQGFTTKFYVLWLPVLSLKREFYISCHHCKGVYNKYNMKTEVYRELERSVHRRVKPYREYAPALALLLVVLLLIYFIR